MGLTGTEPDQRLMRARLAWQGGTIELDGYGSGFAEFAHHLEKLKSINAPLEAARASGLQVPPVQPVAVLGPELPEKPTPNTLPSMAEVVAHLSTRLEPTDYFQILVDCRKISNEDARRMLRDFTPEGKFKGPSKLDDPWRAIVHDAAARVNDDGGLTWGPRDAVKPNPSKPDVLVPDSAFPFGSEAYFVAMKGRTRNRGPNKVAA